MKRQKLEIGERGEEQSEVLAETSPRAQCGSGPRKGGGAGSSETRSKKWAATTGNAKTESWANEGLSVSSLTLMSAGRGQEEDEGPALDNHPTGFVELQEWRKRNQTRLAKPSTLQAASQQGPQTLGRRHLGKIGGKRVNPAFQL